MWTAETESLQQQVGNMEQPMQSTNQENEKKLVSMRDHMKQDQESGKCLLVGTVKQLGLQERVTGKVGPTVGHSAVPGAPPDGARVPNEAVDEHNINARMNYRKLVNVYDVNENDIARILKNVTYTIENLSIGRCYYCHLSIRLT